MHNATRRDLRPGRLGFDYDRPRGADRRTGSRSCRATGSGSSRCRAGSPTRSGSTTTHFDMGYHVRRSALPRPGSHDQLRELVARIVSRPLDRTARCGRSTSSRGSPRAGSPSSPRRHQTWSTASRPSTSARCCSTADPGAQGAGARRLAAAARPVVRAAWSLDALNDSVAEPRTAGRHRPRHADAGARTAEAAGDGSAGSSTRSPAGARRATRRSTAGSPSSAASSRSAPTSPTTARSARRTAARSTTSSSPPSPAGCAPG